MIFSDSDELSYVFSIPFLQQYLVSWAEAADNSMHWCMFKHAAWYRVHVERWRLYWSCSNKLLFISCHGWLLFIMFLLINTIIMQFLCPQNIKQCMYTGSTVAPSTDKKCFCLCTFYFFICIAVITAYFDKGSFCFGEKRAVYFSSLFCCSLIFFLCCFGNCAKLVTELMHFSQNGQTLFWGLSYPLDWV